MKKRTVFDRLVEEPEFYVQVQKNKLKLVVVLGVIALLVHWLK